MLPDQSMTLPLPEPTAVLPPEVRLAVLGDPIQHSLSPVLQNAGLAARGFPFRYDRLHVREVQLGETFQRLRRTFIGWNLTLPLKLSALDLVDEFDDEARRLGAINTVAVRDGRLIGTNTDGLGLHLALEEAFGAGWKSKRILILGAGGGAGSAAARYLARAGVPCLLLANRTLEKLDRLTADLAQMTRVKAYAWQHLAAAFAEAELIINATSVGLDGSRLEWEPGWLRSDHTLFDLVYRAEPTPVVAWARQRGVFAQDGLAMLFHQGVSAFVWWFGEPVPATAMRQALYTAAGRGGYG
jgi:shikimate dehydrogenase